MTFVTQISFVRHVWHTVGLFYPRALSRFKGTMIRLCYIGVLACELAFWVGRTPFRPKDDTTPFVRVEQCLPPSWPWLLGLFHADCPHVETGDQLYIKHGRWRLWTSIYVLPPLPLDVGDHCGRGWGVAGSGVGTRGITVWQTSACLLWSAHKVVKGSPDSVCNRAWRMRS